MVLGMFIPLIVGAAIIGLAVRGYYRHQEVEDRVCRDVRRVLFRIAPLAGPETADTAAATPSATPRPAQS